MPARNIIMKASPGPDLHFPYSGLTDCFKPIWSPFPGIKNVACVAGRWQAVERKGSQNARSSSPFPSPRTPATQANREQGRRRWTWTETFVSRLFHSTCQRFSQSMLNAALAGVEIAPFLVGPRKKNITVLNYQNILREPRSRDGFLIIQTQTHQIRGIPWMILAQERRMKIQAIWMRDYIHSMWTQNLSFQTWMPPRLFLHFLKLRHLMVGIYLLA